MNKEELRNLSNEELFKLLNKTDWLDRELLREYDERSHDGRIPRGPLIPQDQIEQYIKNKYSQKRKKKAS